MIMITPKSFTVVAALFVGGTSLAMAQNGLPTGGEPPVAGGANGNPLTPGFDQAPGAYIAQPGYAVVPAYVAQPGYLEELGSAPAPGRVPTTHQRSMYMYVSPHRSSHTHKITPNGCQ
jgi:hypothetical protein